ncbi:MAG: hypothetical protein GXP62_04040 [Oligoflexia bacterium]|nr:hypothetical protein [Oligoflexia bacterium]
MARVEAKSRVFPIAGGLHDSVDPRLLRPDEASAMNRVEHNRYALEGGQGSVKVTRSGLKATGMRFGKRTFKDGSGGYVCIPANDRYYNLIATPKDFTLEFFLYIHEHPDDTSDSRTLVCHGAPYTSGLLSWEVNLISSTSSGNDSLIQFAWRDSTVGFNQVKSFSRKLHLRTPYHIRLVFRLTNSPQEVDLYVDNVFQETIQLYIGSSRPIQAVNAPIYLGGAGLYGSPWHTQAAKVTLQDVRLWDAALSASDEDVTRYSSEVLDPVGHTYEDNLQGWWPLDDGYGRVVRDRSRWSNDGYMGPSAIVVTEGKKAADGAIFLDGHTSFLQADLRWRDLFSEEFLPFNHKADAGTLSEVKVGLSVRCAVLDQSWAGSSAVRFAELAGNQGRDRPTIALGLTTDGRIRFQTYYRSGLTALTGDTVTPGIVHMWEGHIKITPTAVDISLYEDGAVKDSTTLLPSGNGMDDAVRLRIGCTADYTTRRLGRASTRPVARSRFPSSWRRCASGSPGSTATRFSSAGKRSSIQSSSSRTLAPPRATSPRVPRPSRPMGPWTTLSSTPSS